ncbi:hypothetical protein GEMRC1_005593 [Eukaryota sp. GEM-RC1]
MGTCISVLESVDSQPKTKSSNQYELYRDSRRISDPTSLDTMQMSHLDVSPRQFDILAYLHAESCKYSCQPDELTFRHLKGILGSKFKQYLDLYTEDDFHLQENWQLTTLIARHLLNHLSSKQKHLDIYCQKLTTSQTSAPAVATAVSRKASTLSAIKEAFYDVSNQLGCPPSALCVFYSSVHPSDLIQSTITSLAPDIPFYGCTTHSTVITEKGVAKDISSETPVFSFLAIRDPKGFYFSKGIPLTDPDSLTDQISQVCDEAMTEAKKHGNDNLLSVAYAGKPGHESCIISSLETYFPKTVSIFGCVASFDTSTTNECSVVSSAPEEECWLSLLFIFSSCPAVSRFTSGFAPTATSGIITKTSSNRTIEEIDNEAAAVVYSKWAPGTINDLLTSEEINRRKKTDTKDPILTRTTLFPLGILSEESDEEEETYQLLVPAYLTKSLGISLFVDVEEGQELTLMAGTRKQILRRVIALNRLIQGSLCSIHGGLFLWCAAVQGVFDEEDFEKLVFPRIKRIYKDAPFLMMFPYGEVGKLGYSTTNKHLNLSFGTLSFGVSCPLAPAESNESLAMLFSDIQDSTRLWVDYPEEMNKVSALHDSIWSKALSNPCFNAYAVKTEGDSYFIVSRNAKSLLSLALYVQFQLLSADYPANILNDPLCKVVCDENGKILFRGIRIRFGINVGSAFSIRTHSVESSRKDFFGPSVNLASRICNSAKGGQIFIGDEARQACEDYDFALFGGGSFKNIGEFCLKGFQCLTRIYEVGLNCFNDRTYDSFD